VENIADKMEDIAHKMEDKDDSPNSDRDSPNMDAKTPNMDAKTTTGLDTPNTDRNIPNMDRDIYMGSRVEKDSNHDRGNEDMGEDTHNLGKKTAVPELDWLPSMKLKA
jgi:hypothetical protein